MRITLVGATGFIGSKILAEAVARGHEVVAICRHPENLASNERVHAVFAEVNDTSALTNAFEGSAAVVHSYAQGRDPVIGAWVAAHGGFAGYVPADEEAHRAGVDARIQAQTAGTRSIIAAAKAAKVKRILAVGGAGTLLIDGVRSLDRPEFPKAFEGGAKSTAVVKEILKAEAEGIEWTVLCPSTMITPGERTGRFRLGLDDLLVAEDGSSRISVEDYAMAMVDELESPRHTGRRFTVGY